MAQDSGEIKFKVGLVGESGVGKSCLFVKWVDDDFFEATDNYTIGVDFKYKTMTVRDQKVKLQIYDTAGQERFRTVTASFYRGAHGILLVYDITDADSFKGKVDEWVREIRNYTEMGTPVILLGNKVDMEDKRQMDMNLVKEFVEKEKITYIETSAKTGKGVSEAFMSLTEQMLEQRSKKRVDVNPAPLEPPITKPTTKKRRCIIL